MSQSEFRLVSPSEPKAKARAPPQPKEYKVVAIRECPTVDSLQLCDTPDKAAQYWNTHIKTHPYFTSDREYFVVLFLNTRRKVKGHTLVPAGLILGNNQPFGFLCITSSQAGALTGKRVKAIKRVPLSSSD